MTADLAAAAQLACLLEASAPKPGNVSPGRHFSDVRYEHFLASAAAIGEPLSAAGSRPLGETIRLATEATARWVPSNTNLGIVLLLAPLARAAALLRTEKGSGGVSERDQPHTASRAVAEPEKGSGGVSGAGAFSVQLRQALRRVLASTTVDDARHVYAAIRLAAPGGLGQAPAQDVAGDPTMPLLDVMRLAADRDGIAREYTTGFEITFETAVPALERARHDGLPWDDAVVETFLTLLVSAPDTHVARRGGAVLSVEISGRAKTTLDAGGVRSAAGRRAIEAMDHWLRDPRHLSNPGTTADLTAAAIFVVLLGGGWSLGGSNARR